MSSGQGAGPSRRSWKVLLVNDYAVAGGAEGVVEDTESLLRDAGASVARFTVDDLRTQRRTPVSYVWNRAAREALRQQIVAFRPHIVHYHNVYHALSPSVLSVAAAAGVGSVLTAHDWHLVCPSPAALSHGGGVAAAIELPPPQGVRTLRPRWDKSRSRSALRKVQYLASYEVMDQRAAIDTIICPSAFQAEIFRAVLPNRVRHVPNPVPADDSLPSRVADGFRAVFAGRVEPSKGLAEFIEAAPKEFLAALSVIGDGSDLERCRRVAAARGAAVRFHGRMSRRETLACLADATVAVLPSRWHEIQPLSVLEAQSLGLALLTSRLGGLAELADADPRSETFDPFDQDSIARACRRVFESNSAGRSQPPPKHLYQTHSRPGYVQNLLDEYERVASATYHAG